MISGHAIPYHLYADDSQLYVSFASGDSPMALNGLQSCLASAQSWMSTKKLKLNPHKTEFLLTWNERQQSKYLPMFPIDLLGVKANPAKSARNLGVIFDKYFTYYSYIYQQSVAHAFTICGICGAFAVILICIVQNHLQLLLCPVVSINAINFCMVLPTLTSHGLSVYRIN